MTKRARNKHVFSFKAFDIHQDKSIMKVGTDGALLGAWVDVEHASNALDIGTGTGLIAIMMGQRNSSLNITGVEIDPLSAEQASENANRSPWSDRLTIEHIAIQDFANASSQSFDLIVTNPPFFTGGVMSDTIGRAEARHTVKLSHSDLLQSVKKLLTKEGKFSLILPYFEGLKFIEIGESFGLYPHKITSVFPKKNSSIERLLIEMRQTPANCVLKTDIIIQYEARNDWTPEFRQLMKAFYLNA